MKFFKLFFYVFLIFVSYISSILFASKFSFLILLPYLVFFAFVSLFFFNKNLLPAFCKKYLMLSMIVFISITSIFLILYFQNIIVKKNMKIFPLIKTPNEISTNPEFLKKGKIIVSGEDKQLQITFGPYLHLPDGIYNIELNYKAMPNTKVDSKILIKGGRVKINSERLNPENTSETIEFVVMDGQGADIEVSLFYYGKGYFELQGYKITPVKENLFSFLNLLKNIINSLSTFMIVITLLSSMMQKPILSSSVIRDFVIAFSTLILNWCIFIFQYLKFIDTKNSSYLINLLFFFFFFFIVKGYLNLKLSQKSIEEQTEVKRDILIKFSIIFIGFMLRVVGINNGLPEINLHPDELDLVERALRAFVNLKINPAPFFHLGTYSYFQIPFYAFFNFTGMLSGKIYSLGYWLTNPHEALLISRFFSVFCSLFSIFLVIEIGKNLFNKIAGYISGLFMSVVYMDVVMSHIAKADTFIVFLILVFSYSILKFYNSEERKYLFLSAIFIGISSAVKLNNIILIIPLLLIYIFVKWEKEKFSLKDLNLAFFVTFLSLVIFNPMFVLKTKDVLGGFFIESRMGRNTLISFSDMLNGWKFHLSYSLFFGTGFGLLLTGIIGAYKLFFINLKKATVILTFPFIYFLLLGNVTRHFGRYVMPIIPFLLISSSVLINSIFKDRKILALVVAILIVPNLIYDIDIDILFSKKNNSLIVGEYISNYIEEDKTIGHLGDSSYAKVTKIKNPVVDIKKENLPDYIIVYYNTPNLKPEEEEILKNYSLLKYFAINKTQQRLSLMGEHLHEIKMLLFERFRCDIAIYEKN